MSRFKIVSWLYGASHSYPVQVFSKSSTHSVFCCTFKLFHTKQTLQEASFICRSAVKSLCRKNQSCVLHWITTALLLNIRAFFWGGGQGVIRLTILWQCIFLGTRAGPWWCETTRSHTSGAGAMLDFMLVCLNLSMLTGVRQNSRAYLGA